MRISRTHRRVASSTALVAGSLLAAQTVLGQTQPSITLDLRVDGTGGKNAVVQNIGDQIVLDLYASPHGLDGDDSNDGISFITCGLESSTGGLRGNLLGLEPPSPFDSNGWSAGAQNDLDGDGDLDIGPAAPSDPTTSTGYYALRENTADSYTQPTGGYFVGQMLFTVASLAGDSTTINVFKRPHFESILTYIDNSQFAWIDQSDVMIGQDITIERGTAGGGGPVQYIDGTYDSHVSITENTAVTPGKTLVLSKGFDLSATGVLDTTTGAGATFNINDSSSGNSGGSLLAQGMSIATTGDGAFTQGAGYSRFDSIDIGATAGHTGTFSVTGGRLDSGPVTVGAGGTGSFIQSDGSATIASLTIAGGSSASANGGNLLVPGNVQIGNGGDATLTVAGGQIAANGDLTFGANAGDHGSLVISDGSISARATILGSLAHGAGTLGSGTVLQTGGSFVPGAMVLSSGSPGTQSAYQFENGNLHANSLSIGSGGVATQSGGDGVVTSTLNVIGPGGVVTTAQPMQYDMSGGTLNVGVGIIIDYTNTAPLPGSGHAGGFVQTGGAVTTKDLHITSRGTYEALGGTLNVNGNLLLEGKLDFGGSATTANFGTNSFADFSPGQLIGTQNATFTGAPGSLMNFAPGADPYSQIGHISTQGLIHINGQPLTIPGDKSVGGSGTIVGNVTNNGALTPGNSPGEIDIAGDYIQAPLASLAMQIAGTASDEFDLVSITGDANLDGSLSVELLDGFVPSPSDRFIIVSAGDLTGTFSDAVDSINLPGGRFDVIYSPTSVTLTGFQSVPEPASVSLLALGALMAMRQRRRRHG